ncbi:AsmA family protein [Catalinimonas niigatensis]|uniref:hypothetical protein n=1 Tax=Catalinimonas niigatensis TaxID=1397264 RepID=UPI0026661FB4|nr:hypothetical protein [Catalinimonas niigatensis]WPP51526.1 hypothetical protein PZB72_03885 [Catalinimonas niigatensis]
MKKRAVKRWVWGILGSVLLIVLLGQALLLFFGDEIFKESILLGFRRYSEQAFEPGKRPTLDFDNLSINVFTGNLSVTGLYYAGYLNIDADQDAQADHIKLSVPEADIKGVKFLDLYNHQQLRLKEIRFNQPEIQFLRARKTDTNRPTPKESIQILARNLQGHLSEYLNSVSFNSFKIWDGNVFITQQNAATDISSSNISNKFHAQHVNFSLYDFLLDSSSLGQNDRIFFTKDIDIQLGDYQLLLSDSSYLLKADTLGFSTKHKRIYLKELQMLPVSSGNDLRVHIPEISLTEIDWRDLYFDSLLVANQLVFTEPSITLQILHDSLKARTFHRLDVLHPDSLYQKISTKLSKLQINDIVFDSASLQVHRYGKDTLELLKIEDANLLLTHVELDSVLGKDSLSMVLPADSVTLDIGKLKLYLPDQRHYFTAESASLQTDSYRNFGCDVYFDAVMFKAGVDSLEELLLAPPSKPLAYEVNISSASFFGIQLETMTRDKAALLDSILITSPKVKIANFAPQSVGKQASGRFQYQSQVMEEVPESIKSLLYDWSNAQLNLSPIIAPGDSSALFQWLKAGKLQIDSGQFQIIKAKDDLSGFTQITSIDTFYATLDTISIDHLDKDSAFVFEDSKVAVLASDMDIFLKNSRFLLPGQKGEGGTLNVEAARISTLSEEAYFKNIRFLTNPNNPPSTEVWLDKMYIPYVKFNKIDLKKIYQEQQAGFAFLAVYSPQIILNYKENDQPKRELRFDIEELYPQLSSYLNKLSVPSARINNAKLLLQKISKKGIEPLFAAQKLDVHLKGFYLDSLTHMSRVRPFYADVLDVKAQDYQWNFYPEDETYPLLGLKGGEIHYNSYEGQLDMGKLNMITNIPKGSDLHNLQIYCEKIMADDIDPYRLIHDQLLQVGRLIITKPSYQVEERTKSKHAHQDEILVWQSLQPDLNKLLNTNLRNIHLRYVNVEKGKLSYLRRFAADTLSFVSVDSVEFKARNIRVNHQKNRHLHNILYADEIDFNFFTDHLLINRGGNKHKVTLRHAYFSSRDSHLRVGKLQISPPKEVFNLEENTHIAFNTTNLHLRGLDFKKAYLYGDFNVQQLNINHADSKVYLAVKQTDAKDSTASIHEVISPYLKKLNIEEIIFPESSLEIYDKKTRKISFTSPKLKANISNFYLDQTRLDKQISSITDSKQTPSERMFFAEDVSISIQDYSRSLDDGLYLLSADVIKIESAARKIGISGLKLQPQLSRSQFLKKFEYNKSLAHLYVDQIELNEVDFEEMLKKKNVIVGRVDVYEPTLEIFRDNQLPRDETKRPGLHQELLFNLDHLVNIHQLQIIDGLITYAERAEDAEKDGVITFEALNATGANLTNDPAAVKDSVVTMLDVTALVLGEGKLKTSFRFPLASKSLKFYINGTLDKMDLTKFNQILEPVAFVHIKEGVNQEMRFNFSGDREKSTGTMIFRYNNLSVQMIDREKGNTGFDEKLGSFIANAFVLKANNPKAVFLRIGNISYQRDPSKAMFHYWWQSILSGVKSSIGIDKNMEKTKDFADLKND